MKILKNICIVSALTAALASCSFLDVTPDIIEGNNFYQSRKEVESGLIGVYGVIGREEFYGSYYSVMASNIDDLSYFNRQTTNTLLQFNTHDASSSEIYQIWCTIYEGIKNANNFMEAVMDSEFDADHR